MSEEPRPPLRLRTGAEIPRRSLRLRTMTAGGPGGQHVNRSNTAVELTVALRDLPLDAAQRDLVRSRLGTRLTRRGELRLVASAQRSQLLNRRAAERRLVELLDAALEVERPRTPTSPSRAARARRQAERKRAQARHAERRWSPGADE